jgi:hypothetical protein
MQLKSIYNKNLGFIEQKMYLWTLQKGSNKKKSINLHYFCHDIFFSNDLFSAALYTLILVLHKNVLFHCDTFSVEPTIINDNFKNVLLC